ncbi:hypothetical protein IWQ60_006795 [Tieghemiomyces parasiticus]|uniref:Anoctamin transmembrane domain-containing protein n=1 Tax=Tieghemiomyces parasiticus TaxID=78921 RepID=A0A9W8A548_9FUNG|nr:hypothetical protein IWQ60_006795 [Tieghemiomyces parasiticus]
MSAPRPLSETLRERLRPGRLWGRTTTGGGGSGRGRSTNQPDPSEFVDFVMVFRYDTDRDPPRPVPSPQVGGPTDVASPSSARPAREHAARAAYQEVLQRLRGAGLEWYTTEEASLPGRVFLFVTCPDACFRAWLLQSRAHDWIAGVRLFTPTDFAAANGDSTTSSAAGPDPKAPTASLDRKGGGSGVNDDQCLAAAARRSPDTRVTANPLLKILQLDQSELHNVTPAERLRLVYRILTADPSEGGAGLHPERHPAIETIYPLHNKRFTRNWIKTWSLKWLIDQRDLSAIRDHLGEKVALYFAFLQFYFLWLLPPALAGTLAYLWGAAYSAPVALFVLGWSIAFTEVWARRQVDIATHWGTHQLSAVDEVQPKFVPEAIVTDPVTGERTPYFSPAKLWLRRAATAPLMLVAALLLALVIGFLFAVQTLADEHYTGPGQAYMTYLPAVLYAVLMGHVSSVYQQLARRLNDYENHRTVSQYEYNLSQKIFVLSFLVNYLSQFLVAWVYIPFRADINHHLMTWSAHLLGHAPLAGESLHVGEEGSSVQLKVSNTPADQLLLNNLFFFVLTGQVLSFFQETLIPIAMRYVSGLGRRTKAKAEAKVKAAVGGASASRTQRSTSMSSTSTGTSPSAGSEAEGEETDTQETAAAATFGSKGNRANGPFTTTTDLAELPPLPPVGRVLGRSPSAIARAPVGLRRRLIRRALREYELPEYDIYDDYAEMVTQFGFVALFSVVWPLAPLVSFINNWVELRSDAVKICINVRRPIPQRTESIGPWLGNLKLLCWMASITNALLVYQFGTLFPTTTPEARLYGNTNFTVALGTLLVVEHLYFGLHLLVRKIINSFPSAASKIIAFNDYQQKRDLYKELAAAGSNRSTSSAVLPSSSAAADPIGTQMLLGQPVIDLQRHGAAGPPTTAKGDDTVEPLAGGGGRLTTDDAGFPMTTSPSELFTRTPTATYFAHTNPNDRPHSDLSGDPGLDVISAAFKTK